MTTTRLTLHETILELGKDCKLSQKEVYERLQDFKDIPSIEEPDKKGLLPLQHALVSNNLAAVDWLLDESQHPKAKINVENYYCYLGILTTYFADEGALESKEPVVLKRKQLTDFFVTKMWKQNKPLSDRITDFKKMMHTTKGSYPFISPTVGFMHSMINAIDKHILPEKTDIIIPLLSFFLQYAITYQRPNAIKYIISICKEKNDRPLEWFNKLIQLPENKSVVSKAINSNIGIAKYLIENKFPSTNDEDPTNGILVNLLKQHKENKISEQGTLEITKLVIGKYVDEIQRKTFYLKPIHLQLALQCHSQDLLLYLLTNSNKHDISLQEVINAGWKSIAHMVDFYFDNNIAWECMTDRDRFERPAMSLIPLLLSEKTINKNTLKKIIRKKEWVNLIEVTSKDIEFAINTKDKELVSILLNNYAVTANDIDLALKTKDEELVNILSKSYVTEFKSHRMASAENIFFNNKITESKSISTSFSKTAQREMWKYPALLSKIENELNFSITYAGDYPLTHILQNLINGKLGLQQALSLIRRSDVHKTWDLKNIELALHSKDLELIKKIISSSNGALKHIREHEQALLIAVELGDEKIVALLLSYNALAIVDAPFYTTKSIWIPSLYKAVEKGYFDIAKLIFIFASEWRLYQRSNKTNITIDLLDILDKENSSTPADLRWRMKKFLMVWNIQNYHDLTLVKKVHTDDHLALCYYLLTKVDVKRVNLKEYFTETIFQQAQQLVRDKNFLKSIYDANSALPIVQPSAPELKEPAVSQHSSANASERKDSPPLLTTPSAPEAKENEAVAVITEGRPVTSLSNLPSCSDSEEEAKTNKNASQASQPALAHYLGEQEQKKEPLSLTLVMSGNSSEKTKQEDPIPVIAEKQPGNLNEQKETAPSVKEKTRPAFVEQQVVLVDPSAIQTAPLPKSPNVIKSEITPPVEDIQYQGPLPANASSAEGHANKVSLVCNASHEPDVERQTGLSPVSKGSVVSNESHEPDVEGQPGLSPAKNVQSDFKSVPPGFTQFSCSQFSPDQKLKSRQRFFEKLFDMTERTEVWDNNLQLKEALQVFCSEQIKQLSLQNKNSTPSPI